MKYVRPHPREEQPRKGDRRHDAPTPKQRKRKARTPTPSSSSQTSSESPSKPPPRKMAKCSAKSGIASKAAAKAAGPETKASGPPPKDKVAMEVKAEPASEPASSSTGKGHPLCVRKDKCVGDPLKPLRYQVFKFVDGRSSKPEAYCDACRDELYRQLLTPEQASQVITPKASTTEPPKARSAEANCGCGTLTATRRT